MSSEDGEHIRAELQRVWGRQDAVQTDIHRISVQIAAMQERQKADGEKIDGIASTMRYLAWGVLGIMLAAFGSFIVEGGLLVRPQHQTPAGSASTQITP